MNSVSPTIALVVAVSCAACSPAQEPDAPASGSTSATPAVSVASTAAPITSAPKPPDAEVAIEGELRCVFPDTPLPTKPLERVGAVVDVYGGESFCARDGAGALWCGTPDTRRALVQHPITAPLRVSVTRDGYCAVAASGEAVCLVRAPQPSGGKPVPSGLCQLHLTETHSRHKRPV